MKYLLFIGIVLLSSCTVFKSHEKWLFEHQSEVCATLCSQPIDTNISVNTKDSVYTIIETEYIGADSLLMNIYFECDSNRNVLIRVSETMKTERGRLLYQLNQGKLTITALLDSIAIKNKIIHEVKTNVITKTITVPVWTYKTVKERYIPFWVYVVFTLSAVAIGYLLFKRIRL